MRCTLSCASSAMSDISAPAETATTAEDAFRSSCHAMLGQSHMCPFLASVQPVLWDFDHALGLFPPPDALVIAEPGQVHNVDVGGVRCSHAAFDRLRSSNAACARLCQLKVAAQLLAPPKQ